MDSRKARREAERAARDRLGNDLIAVVGDLGVALALHSDAESRVEGVRAEATAHVEKAKLEAKTMVEAAQAAVRDAEQEYRSTYDRALEAGWSNGKLKDMGYPAPRRTRPSSNGKPSSEPSTATPPDAKAVSVS